MKTLLGSLLVVMLAGCSTTPGIKAQIAGANIEIAKQRAEAAAKPILDARIPTPEGIMTIIVHAPQGSGNTQVSMPDDPAWRTAESAVRMLGTGLNFWLGGQAAVGLIEAGSTGIVNALRVQPVPTVVMQPSPVIVDPAEPIIVNQPAPVIIEQPEPIILTQPAPIIVEQPEPIIISPVFAP